MNKIKLFENIFKESDNNSSEEFSDYIADATGIRDITASLRGDKADWLERKVVNGEFDFNKIRSFLAKKALNMKYFEDLQKYIDQLPKGNMIRLFSF